ncbi:hypothetical protein L3N51_00788 [Metallosphaera sp. J1]|nr:hypothetical protein [Metallosphaera javensis (ex Hofmann et al. 2022)]
MTRYGGNPRCLASVVGESSKIIAREILEMQREHQLALFPAVFSEGLGLGKYLIVVRNCPIKYETASRLFHPIMNLFRGDMEENLFSITLFADGGIVEDIIKALNALSCSLVIATRIKQTRKFVRDPTCYDFESHRWICVDKLEIRQGEFLRNPHEQDIKGVVSLQVNPFADIRIINHRNHVFKIVTGFMYVLGKSDFVVQVISKEELTEYIPDVVWTAEGEDIFISEMHVNKQGLEAAMKKVRDRASEIIISPKSPLYALGYSLPYEIFRNGKWIYPKIEINKTRVT